MARDLHSRWKISGTLVTTSPISVGGMSKDAIVDLALAIDGQGKYYIPGTSLAGALRNWMERNYDKDLANKLFGYQANKGEKGGHASFIVIADISIDSKYIFEIRDGVGIDRESGTAAENFKYNRAVLPKGTELPINISIERDEKLDESKWEEYKTAIAHMLEALKTGKIPIGAAKTRGLGRAKLNETDFKIEEDNLQTREGILAALGYHRNGNSLNNPFVFNSTKVAAQSAYLEIKIDWKPVGPVMVKAEAEGVAVDTLPLTSANGENLLTFVLPGSSIKGSLRSQAERIVRTVKGIDNTNTNAKLEAQIEVPLVTKLFGKAAKIDINKDSQEREQLGRIGALSVVDCYAVPNIFRENWASIESAKSESELRSSLDAAKLSHTKQAIHVAIDRWTGGAAEGMLYSTLELFEITWEPILLEVDLSRMGEQKHEAIALVLLVLRDMMRIKIPLGYATNRGMGAIAVTSIKIAGSGLEPDLSKLADVTLTGENLCELDENLRKSLTQKWNTWIDKPLIDRETKTEEGVSL